METNARFNPLQDSNGARLHITKPEIIPGHPDGEFADIKSIDKETTDTRKFILREATTNMTEKDRPK